MNKTPAEMWELASALHLHGADVDKLSSLLPHWERSDIATILRRFKGKARRDRHIIEKGRKAFQAFSSKKLSMKIEENLSKPETHDSNAQSANSNSVSEVSRSTDTSLVVWSELLQKIHSLEGTRDKLSFGVRVAKSAPVKGHSQLLSKALLYVSSMEDHYQGGSADEASYSEIYRYMAQLLAGEEPTQLRPKSAAKVLEMVDRLTAALSSGAFKEAIAALRRTDLSYIKEFCVKPLDAETPRTCSADTSRGGGLFEEVAPSAATPATSTLKEQIEVLDPDDPYFEEDREKVNTKLIAVQKFTASHVGNIPGMNPLNLPADVMTKPLKAFGSNYPGRKES